jgi:hypothetical protein
MKYYLGGLVLGAMVLASAQAEEVTFQYTAVINRTMAGNVDQPGIAFSGTTLAENDTLRGIVTLDRSTYAYSDGAPGPGPITYAHYKDGGSTTRASMTVDRTGFNFTSVPAPYLSDVSVTNSSYDHVSIDIFNSGYSPGAFAGQALTFDFHDNDGTQLPGLGYPSLSGLAGWETATLLYYIRPNDSNVSYWAYATITAFNQVTAPVPEPASIAMLSLGLLTVGGAAYRRRQRSTSSHSAA